MKKINNTTSNIRKKAPCLAWAVVVALMASSGVVHSADKIKSIKSAKGFGFGHYAVIKTESDKAAFTVPKSGKPALTDPGPVRHDRWKSSKKQIKASSSIMKAKKK